MATVIPDRLATIEGKPLSVGSHDSIDSGMCVMEAVSYVAGEPWSDRPTCASPVIAAFLRRWNDDLPDADRQMLAPLIPRLVGTAAPEAVEQKRAWLVADWCVRVSTPAWLRAAKLDAHADAVAALPELRGPTDLTPELVKTLEAARTARAAARDAAWDAAWDAARDAARDALHPVVRWLQRSAMELVGRMIAAACGD